MASSHNSDLPPPLLSWTGAPAAALARRHGCCGSVSLFTGVWAEGAAVQEHRSRTAFVMQYCMICKYCSVTKTGDVLLSWALLGRTTRLLYTVVCTDQEQRHRPPPSAGPGSPPHATGTARHRQADSHARATPTPRVGRGPRGGHRVLTGGSRNRRVPLLRLRSARRR